MNGSFLSQIESAVMTRQGMMRGAELRFLCPVHDDHHPSAAWNLTKSVWHCFVCGAGGGAYSLAKLLGVDPAPDPSGLTLEELASYVGLPVEFLRSVGLSSGVVGTERV